MANSKQMKIYLVCQNANHSELYSPWMEQLSFPTVVVQDGSANWIVPDDAILIVTHLHFAWDNLALLRRSYQQNKVPILILCDGVLEYRNTWQNDSISEGVIYQPVFGHKIACLGRGQARILESWGNVGKCEIVGLPRLDSFLERAIGMDKKRERDLAGPGDLTGSDQPIDDHLDALSASMEAGSSRVETAKSFRLLVATAKQPAFNDQQRRRVINSLNDLKQSIEAIGQIQGRSIEVAWRLTGGLEQEIGLPTNGNDSARPPLIDQICQSDAVITTPSTLYLESILLKRPTAILDYHGCPSYVPAAWTISAAEHIEPVLRELADPPHAKMLFQQSTLVDQLECQSPATTRMVTLIETMAKAGMTTRNQTIPLTLPVRILTDPNQGFGPVSPDFDLAKLFPENRSFQIESLQQLQIELAAAIQKMGTLPDELNQLKLHIAYLIESLEQAKLRNRDIHVRWIKLQKEHGIKPKFDYK